MEDRLIVDLYWNRCENAIAETNHKFGRYCFKIAFNILADEYDSEECVNDTYLKVWETIPPAKPNKLAAFLGKITRNLALNRLKHNNTLKRGGGQVTLALDELSECVPDNDDAFSRMEDKVLSELLDRFLEGLSAENRKIFVKRYFEFAGVGDIAAFYSITESKVKMSLHRTRSKLKQYLEKEGISL